MRPHLGVARGLLALAVFAFPARAERLPIRVYTAEDGLAGDQINAVLEDSRGFLWVATDSGVSRFDGERFTNYAALQGLPSARVVSIAETRDGGLWLATAGGFAKLRTSGGLDAEAFTAFPGRLTGGAYWPTLQADPAGGLWASTPRGLLHTADLERPDFRPVPLGPGRANVQIAALARCADGSLWIGADQGLLRRFPDGRVLAYRLAENRPVPHSLLCDRGGRVWAGTASGLFVLSLEPAVRIEAYDRRSGLLGDHVTSIAEARDGSVWVAADGLAHFVGGRLRATIGVAQGLAESGISHVIEDRDGNIWAGSVNRGLMRVAAGGFVSYGEADGLANDRIASVFSDAAGALWVMTSGVRLYRNDGGRFVDVSPPALAQARHPSWGSHQFAVHDRAGEWWLPTSEGLLRYAASEDLPRARLQNRYGEGRGLPGNDIHRIWADTAGDLWVSIVAPAGPLVRWQRREERFEVITELRDRFAATSVPTAFAEDDAGDLWVGFFAGGLARRRSGRWEFFGAEIGVPPGFVWDLHCDRRGRLWIASSLGGVGRLDEPAAARPAIAAYTTAQGLSSDAIDCITEDRQGRLYFGNRRGVDRLDPESGSVRTFTIQDGLPSSRVHVCHRDADGMLWFGTLHGLARFDPESVRPAMPRPVWIESVRIGGVAQPLPALGASAVADLVFGPASSSLYVEFLALGHGPGEEVRYQHRLEGADDGWSRPRTERSVEYPHLAPGRYRLAVRAVGAEGAVGPPATIALRVLPPLWRRWWVQTAAAAAVAAVALYLHRGRMARVVAVERMRTRIAADLHDDVGASLSQIAFLSDVAQARAAEDPQAATGALADIGAQARELIDTTSDIVWSIDPRRDDLASLLARLRWFASDLAEARGAALVFDLPDDARAIHLSPEQRRELYLLLKEALHNALKHSRAGEIGVRLTIREDELAAEVSDDGVGFDPRAEANGHGLHSLAARAERLGGRLEIHSAPGAGTRLRLRAPLAGRRTAMRLSRRRGAGDTSPQETADGHREPQ